MKKLICLPFLLWGILTFAQNPDLASQCQTYTVDAATGLPTFVRFKPAWMPSEAQLYATLAKAYRLTPQDSWELTRQNADNLGFRHLTLQHTFAGHAVFGSVIKAHLRGGKVESFNGRVLPVAAPSQASLSEADALAAALDHWGARLYKWQVPEEEAFIRQIQENPAATYYPHGELMYVCNRGLQSAEPMRLAWKFDIYAHVPSERAEVFVDAITGETIFRNQLSHTTSVIGTGNTLYSGPRSFVTDSVTLDSFRLRDATHGNGIETYNMHNGVNFSSATDFTDSNNVWDVFNPPVDMAAIDVHWGAQMTHDYYLLKLGRNSFNGLGGKIRSYVHFDNNYVNASWDGSVMKYGDGAGNMQPLTSLDICGHELTHGVTQYAAALIYQDESGALNESFSDIFGNTVEQYARPSQHDWMLGEDFLPLRDMSNPNTFQNPDTYLGTYWYAGPNDNGGVHTNSGVQNYWYYLLVEGGSDINDNGDTFAIAGLGWDTAAMIAYRNLEVYITSTSDYVAAQHGAIQAAIDLFGECSNEMIQTWNAWAAVGLGRPYNGILDAEFTTPDSIICAYPYTAHFENLSTSAIHYYWLFGDGNDSNAEHPTNTYTAVGDYDVTLIAYGCNGATDTLFFPQAIHIDPSQTCTMTMPTGNDSASSMACNGTLYDSGGNDNYGENSTGEATIYAPNGYQVLLDFSVFSYKPGDRITIYDGPTTASPVIGAYSGTNLPPSATSTGGVLLIRESTNGVNNDTGFVATWTCIVGATDAASATCQLYPNPTRGELRLDWRLPEADAYQIAVTDLRGQVQQQFSGTHDGRLELNLDLSYLAAGVYFVQMQSAGLRIHRKVVIQ